MISASPTGPATASIEELPLSPNDDQIRRAVYRAIYGDPALSTRYGYRSLPPIHIIVENGNVTLEGAVARQMDKRPALPRGILVVVPVPVAVRAVQVVVSVISVTVVVTVISVGVALPMVVVAMASSVCTASEQQAAEGDREDEVTHGHSSSCFFSTASERVNGTSWREGTFGKPMHQGLSEARKSARDKGAI